MGVFIVITVAKPINKYISLICIAYLKIYSNITLLIRCFISCFQKGEPKQDKKLDKKRLKRFVIRRRWQVQNLYFLVH